ncbi:hypothetical protein ACFL2H_00130 [Planctomycetota bacterium]
MTIPATSSASAGLQRAIETMNVAGERIAVSGVTDADAMIRSTVDLKMAGHAVKANVAVLRATDEMTKHLIDILA